jgi:thymidine kinase
MVFLILLITQTMSVSKNVYVKNDYPRKYNSKKMSLEIAPRKSGKIILILSCMFAGKTETLITYARRYILAKKKIVLIKYSKDTRYTVDDICSHNQNSIKATFSGNFLTDFAETAEVKHADVILIDEVQFFPDADILCDFWADSGKVVVAAGLNGNFKREEFPVMSRLIPISEELITLRAVCSICGEDAHFTKRIVQDSNVEFIGGAESYQPRCRRCF